MHWRPGIGDGGTDAGRDAVAHGAVGRADEALVLAKIDEAGGPGGEIAGVAGENGVGRGQTLEIAHDAGEVEAIISGRFAAGFAQVA